MLFQQNEGTARVRQIDLFFRNATYTRITTVNNSLPTFTIRKGLFKNILNGNVRLLINEYMYLAGFSTYRYAKEHKKKRCLILSRAHRFFFYIFILFRQEMCLPPELWTTVVHSSAVQRERHDYVSDTLWP